METEEYTDKREPTRKELRQRIEEYKVLYKISKILHESEELEDVLHKALKALIGLAELEVEKKAGLFLVDEKEKVLRLFCTVGNFTDEFLEKEKVIPFGNCLCGRVAVSGEMITSNDCFTDKRHDNQFKGMTAHGHYIVPLKSRGNMIGVLFLYTDANPPLHIRSQEILMAIGAMIADTIVSHQRKKQVLEQNEELKKLNALKSKFLSVASSERYKLDSDIKKLSMVVEQSPDVVVITDPTGKIEYVNPSFTKSTGYTAQEAIGNYPSVLKSGHTSQGVYTHLWETIAAGKEWRGEFYNKKKDGTFYWESALISPLKNENGEITNFIAVKEDITERKQIESRLRDHEAFIHSTVNSMQDGLITIDASNNIQLFTPSAERIFGYKAHEIVGKNLTILMPESFREKHQAGLDRYLKTGVPRVIGTDVEVEGLRKDGSIVPIEICISEIAKEELSTSQLLQRSEKWFVGVIRDISDRKKSEEEVRFAQRQAMESEKLAAVGQLAAGVSHEVMNPVNIIGLKIQMLKRNTKDDEKTQTFCEKVDNELKRIQKIMGSLLIFSRKGDASFQKGDLKEDLEKVVAILENEFSKDNIEIIRDWCLEDNKISYDPDKLRQVFLNLINNARHALPNGGTITVGSTPLNKSGKGFIRYSFSDTGTGMSKEVKSRIFDPFFTTKPEGEGTGLGLSIVHGIISEHGGDIFVESEEGKGTTFLIDLPVAE